MPLVQDGIASPESEQLVRAHIAVSPGLSGPVAGDRAARSAGTAKPRRYQNTLAAAPPLQHPPVAAGLCGIAVGIALGYTGSAKLGHSVLPLVWSVLTYRDIGMGKPLLLFTLGLAVLDAIIKQMALLESFAPGNFLANLVSGCILYVGLGGVGWLIGWLLHYAKGEYP